MLLFSAKPSNKQNHTDEGVGVKPCIVKGKTDFYRLSILYKANLNPVRNITSWVIRILRYFVEIVFRGEFLTG